MQTGDDEQLSPHFWLSELTVSNEGARRGLRNIPFSAQVANLTRLSALLEDVRRALRDQPILVSSGFRSQAVNTLVGGAPHSSHMQGLAADFTCPGFGGLRLICQRIVDAGIVFDQLILEGHWVHIALPLAGTAPRREQLTARFQPIGGTQYTAGIV